MTTNLNPLAPEYNPIKPGITTNPDHPFSALLSHIIPPPPPQQQQQQKQIPIYSSSHFYAYSYTSSLVQPAYSFQLQNPTPPRILGPRFGTRQVVNGRTGSGLRGRKGVFGRNEKKWGPVCNENKLLGFEKKSCRSREVLPLKWDEEKTSVMIKNIPYDCSRKDVMEVLDEFCMKQNENNYNEETVAYDFLYLPIDFWTKKSRGFAFVNFTNAKAVQKFFQAWNLTKWDSVYFRRWTKAIEIVSAKIQGKEEMVEHFSRSNFECESDEFLPVTFNPARDGSGQLVDMTVIGNRRAFQRWGTRKGKPETE